MAPTYRCGLGNSFSEPDMLRGSGASSANLVATSDGGASPPIGDYWIEEPPEVPAGKALFDVGPFESFTPLNYEWPICAAHRVEGTLGTLQGEENVLEFDATSGDCKLAYDPLGASTFRYHLRDLAGGGDDAYGSTRNTSTNYALRLQFDGTNAKLWVDGVLDITITFNRIPTLMFLTSSSLPANIRQYWDVMVWRGSDDEADRPNTTPTVERIDPDGDNESSDYGDEGTCSGGGGTFTDWLLSGDASDTSIYLCLLGGHNGQETSTMGALTLATPKLVQTRFHCRANLDAKTVTTYSRLRDGTPNTVEKQHTNLFSNDWMGLSEAFPTAPDTGPWTQAKVNDLRAGARSVDSNGANDELAAMCLEVFDLGDDPPAAAADRRRAAGQVI